MDTRGTGELTGWRVILYFLAILALLAGAFPGGTGVARAEDNHTHEGWTAVEALPTASGSYYLTKDIEISQTWTIGSGVNITLCLNDHSVTMTASGVGIIINGGTLNLYDCGTTVHHYTTDTKPAKIGSGSGSFTGGYITHAAGKTGPIIHMKSGQFSMYGGTLIGCDNVKDQYYSGAVDLAGGTFNLYDGTIAGNAGSTWLGGGGIYITAGQTNIYGGEIKNNARPYGGGILSYGGTTTIHNGSIHHNTGTSGMGGGVFIAEGNLSMSGGRIADNTATAIGGIVVNGTFNLSGGSITGNADSGEYGCIYIGGTMNLSGGSITGNNSKSGGILNESGVLNISGNPTVTGNRNAAGNEVNVYLPKNKYINVTGAMTGRASVGITTETVPTAGNPVKFGLNYKTSNTGSPDKWYFSDKGLDVITLNDTSDQNAYLAAKVTLTYDGNGAESGKVPAAQTVTHGSSVKVAGAGNLKRSGYALAGWGREPQNRRRELSDGDIGFYAPGESFMIDGDITLYAQWDAGRTVTWKNGDGTVLDQKIWRDGEPAPTTEKIPDRAEDGKYTYTFSGWDGPDTDGDGNVIYTPRFTAKEKETVPTATDKPVPRTGDSEDPLLLTFLLLVCVGIPAMTLLAKFSLRKRK